MTTKAAMPAYPCQPRNPQGDFVDELQPGLTKREVFAMAAMQGMAMRVCSLLDSEVARVAVTLADATLAAKELAGRQETMVNLRRRNELTRWAKGEKAKNRARNKIAKKSRARNR